MTKALELRVLSGMNRGLRVPIDEDTPLTLGGADDCDVMLHDRALRDVSWAVVVDDLGWSSGPTDVDSAPHRRGIGAVLDMAAGVRVSVCAADAVWDFDRQDSDSTPCVATPDPACRTMVLAACEGDVCRPARRLARPVAGKSRADATEGLKAMTRALTPRDEMLADHTASALSNQLGATLGLGCFAVNLPESGRVEVIYDLTPERVRLFLKIDTAMAGTQGRPDAAGLARHIGERCGRTVEVVCV